MGRFCTENPDVKGEVYSFCAADLNEMFLCPTFKNVIKSNKSEIVIVRKNRVISIHQHKHEQKFQEKVGWKPNPHSGEQKDSTALREAIKHLYRQDYILFRI